MENVRHKGAQCGQEQPRFSPALYSFLLRRPRPLTICHCVYTHRPSNCNLSNISYRLKGALGCNSLNQSDMNTFCQEEPRRALLSLCFLVLWDAQRHKDLCFHTFSPERGIPKKGRLTLHIDGAVWLTIKRLLNHFQFWYLNHFLTETYWFGINNDIIWHLSLEKVTSYLYLCHRHGDVSHNRD